MLRVHMRGARSRSRLFSNSSPYDSCTEGSVQKGHRLGNNQPPGSVESGCLSCPNLSITTLTHPHVSQPRLTVLTSHRPSQHVCRWTVLTVTLRLCPWSMTQPPSVHTGHAAQCLSSHASSSCWVSIHQTLHQKAVAMSLTPATTLAV